MAHFFNTQILCIKIGTMNLQSKLKKRICKIQEYIIYIYPHSQAKAPTLETPNSLKMASLAFFLCGGHTAALLSLLLPFPSTFFFVTTKDCILCCFPPFSSSSLSSSASHFTIRPLSPPPPAAAAPPEVAMPPSPKLFLVGPQLNLTKSG